MSDTLTHLAQPSAVRVVVIDPQAGVARGYYGAVAAPAWPRKDPGDTLDYVADYGCLLAGDEGDAISGLGVQIFPSQPGDLRLVSSAADGARAILWLTGGLAGTIYRVTLTVVTLGGRHVVRTVELPVEMVSSPPIPPGAITDEAGAPITTEGNVPLLVE